MYVYWENEQGEWGCDFTYMDLLFDFLVPLGMYPYVELGFLPRQLAAREYRMFDRASVIAAPRDMSRWHDLIRCVTEHLVRRYGRSVVRRWKFTTISVNHVFLGCMTMEEYETLYETTYHAVKSVDADLPFGGPGCWTELFDQKDGFAAFMRAAKERGCIPDFIAFQSYPTLDISTDPLFLGYAKNQQYVPAVLSRDPSYLSHAVDRLEHLLSQHTDEMKEFFCEEMSSTVWQRDLSNDTSYKAAWIAKNITENAGRMVFGYWSLSDLMNERAYWQQLFHGGYGLLTSNGIPKASYFGLLFCSRLGTEKLSEGPGWIFTRDADGWQLLIYHYCHYRPVYCYRYRKLTHEEDAYTVFEAGELRHLRFSWPDAADGLYRMEQRRIGRECGSAYDAWLWLGAPQEVSAEQTEFLQHKAHPDYETTLVKANNGLRWNVDLQPLDTVLICMRKEQ
mgnify:CR=1 FL=1